MGFPYRTILCPVDFDDNSLNALETATRHAPDAAHAGRAGRDGCAGLILESVATAISAVVTGSDPPEVVYANRAYRSLFGDGPLGHLRLAAAIRAGHGLTLEHEDPVLGRWFEVAEHGIAWIDGRPVTLQLASDITARKLDAEIGRREQEKLELTARLMAMGELASSLAHELNQPLTAIVNYVAGIRDRLRAGALPPDALNTAIDSTLAQAERAAAIIRRIREFVRRAPPQPRATGATRLIAAAAGFAQAEARARGVAIETQIDPRLGPLLVDPILIEQVVLNLLRNALEASAESEPAGAAQRGAAPVVVAAAALPQRRMAQITVADRGGGIPPALRPRLFEPFFTTKPDGLGIGLNLCRSIVEFHGGNLELRDRPGGGTIACFTLPLAPDDGPRAPPTGAAGERA